MTQLHWKGRAKNFRSLSIQLIALISFGNLDLRFIFSDVSEASKYPYW